MIVIQFKNFSSYLKYWSLTRDIDHNQVEYENSNSKFSQSTEPIRKTYWSVKDKDETIETMSILLNEAMNRVGQLSCDISKIDVSQNGGWCSKISGNNSSQHLTDEYLARYMSKFLKGKTVASFGDGPGIYKEILLSLKEVESYDAYDGAPFAESTTDNRVKFLDLSVPIYHLKKYDWVVSLEVAEHIPAKYESVYLDNLVRHAKEGIILSWAKIGQKGHSHINNRDFPYVKEQMEARRFTHDPVSSEKFRNISIFSWLRSNLNVFRSLKNKI
jgi:tryptophanyl-tRNA synthetase